MNTHKQKQDTFPCWVCKQRKPKNQFYNNKSKKNGITTECKECSSKINIEKYHSTYKDKSFDLYFRYRHCRNGAKRRGKVFALTLDEFESITSKLCAYCGCFSGVESYVGVDRLNNNLGYTKDNCVPCCDKCNRFKYTLSVEEMIDHAKKIVEHQNRKESI